MIKEVKMGKLLCIIWVSKCNYKRPCKKGGRRVRVSEGDEMTEAEARAMQPQSKECEQPIE